MLNENSVEIAQSPISGARFRYAVIDMFADSSVEHPTEGDLFTLWLGRWGHFTLEKNAVIVKSTKTLKPILNKLAIDGVLTELTEIN